MIQVACGVVGAMLVLVGVTMWAGVEAGLVLAGLMVGGFGWLMGEIDDASA